MVFFFSGTGNTRWAANAVAKETEEELVFIPDVISGDCHFKLQANERIGFVFPIHGWRPPRIVLKFIEKLDINASGHYCYALVTAGDTVALAIDYLSHALEAKGMHIDSCFSLIMPESYVGLPFMDVDNKERELAKKEKAKSDLNECIKVIVERRKGINRLTKGPLPAFFSGPVGGFFVKFLITDKPFRVDSSKCIGCGLCAKNCPVDDITLVGSSKKHPAWNHNGKCLTCFSCYHHCPVKAIEYGNRTKHKGQYYYERKERNNYEKNK